jgi:hypothetical protein
MEGKNKYPSCDITGGGKIHVHTGDKGEKFKIITMSAEKLQIRTTANVNITDIVTLKVQINSDLFAVNINAIGKIVDKIDLGNEFKYTTEFVGMSDSDKEDIDQLMRSSCNIVD